MDAVKELRPNYPYGIKAGNVKAFELDQHPQLPVALTICDFAPFLTTKVAS